MGHSYTQIRVHVMFHKKTTAPPINPETMGKLCPYMAGVLKKLDCSPIIINGVDDHLHMYFVLGASKSIAEVVRELKKSSTPFIRNSGEFYGMFEWQKGYAAYSVSPGQHDTLVNYIRRQQDHHADKQKTFDYEYRFFMKKYGFPLDDPWILVD